MIQVPSAEDASSPTSELDSPEAAIEDDLSLYDMEPNITLLPVERVTKFGAVMLDFPYHTDGESYHETVVRLADYFRQRASRFPNFRQRSNFKLESSHVDDALHELNNWLNSYLSCAHIEFYPVVIEAYQENRQFWQALPELFCSIGHRYA